MMVLGVPGGPGGPQGGPGAASAVFWGPAAALCCPDHTGGRGLYTESEVGQRGGHVRAGADPGVPAGGVRSGTPRRPGTPSSSSSAAAAGTDPRTGTTRGRTMWGTMGGHNVGGIACSCLPPPTSPTGPPQCCPTAAAPRPPPRTPSAGAVRGGVQVWLAENLVTVVGASVGIGLMELVLLLVSMFLVRNLDPDYEKLLRGL
ncbi:hypothetical protein Q9966_016510 [Columba livia]|nr:hypothetical protein Q9966_016510 [Columba livia]KAK2511956.1 hypothetical protein Q9966_016510 [Columba livia]